VLIMRAAVDNGDAKKLAELMRQDPGFNVSNDHGNGNGWTLLHFACLGSDRSAVIPLLLAYPGINVNLKDIDEQTPFYWACAGFASCVREILKDSRVEVNEPDNDGSTPLYLAAFDGRLDISKWWIASGREVDLGEPGMSARRMPLGWQRSTARQKW